MLDVCNLSFDYQDKPLLHNLKFSLAAGQLLHLRGSNGSGKTTLIKILTGLLQPNEGDIIFEGQKITDNLSDYQKKLCYVGHKPALNAMLTVKENCFCDPHWGRSTMTWEDLLKRFALQSLADELCQHLSAGQKRRVNLLRILMTTAKLWLLDEPLVALDQESISSLMTCFEHHLANGGQIIVSSHQNLPLKQIDYQEYQL